MGPPAGHGRSLQRVNEGAPHFSKGHRQARGGKKSLTGTERRLGDEDLPRSVSLTRLEEGVKSRNNNSLKKKKPNSWKTLLSVANVAFSVAALRKNMGKK